MSVYIIAQLKFTRRELYDRYQSRFMGVFSKFKGKLLVADAHPVVLEGEWPRDKVVIMEFPDDAAARDFQNLSGNIGGSESGRRRHCAHRAWAELSATCCLMVLKWARGGRQPSCICMTQARLASSACQGFIKPPHVHLSRATKHL
jgi:uncharacterized protein (DUF1330 family)